MCNSCNNSLARTLNNLFGSPCGCNNNNYTLASTLNNLFGSGNGGCGCGCGCNNPGWNNFSNGFVSGVNAVNASENGNGGCGCNSGCGCGNGAHLSANGFDNYYARQYALGPYSENSGCGCNCYNY